MAMMPLMANAQTTWGPMPPIPVGTLPPYWGPNSYFEEIWINPTGESSCFGSSATCFEAFSFTLPPGYDDAVVFIADFMIRDQTFATAPIRRVAAAIRNVDYLPSSGDLSFDVTVTLDGGGPRSLEWTMAVAVLLRKGPDIFVSDDISMFCNEDSMNLCAAKTVAPVSGVPPGLDGVTLVPTELAWQVRGAGSLLANLLSFDISATPAFAGGSVDVLTSCGLFGVSPATGAPLPTRCGQVVRAIASATPLFQSTPVGPMGQTDHEIVARQTTYGDGVWSYLYASDPHRTDGAIPVWVQGSLWFPALPPTYLEFSEIGGGCSNPVVGFDQGPTDALRGLYRSPPNCGPGQPGPCPARFDEEDTDNYALGVLNFPFNSPTSGLYRRFTGRFIGLPGTAPSIGEVTCRLLDLP